MTVNGLKACSCWPFNENFPVTINSIMRVLNERNVLLSTKTARTLVWDQTIGNQNNGSLLHKQNIQRQLPENAFNYYCAGATAHYNSMT